MMTFSFVDLLTMMFDVDMKSLEGNLVFSFWFLTIRIDDECEMLNYLYPMAFHKLFDIRLKMLIVESKVRRPEQTKNEDNRLKKGRKKNHLKCQRFRIIINFVFVIESD